MVAVGCLQLRAKPGEHAGHSRAVGAARPGARGHPEGVRSIFPIPRSNSVRQAGGRQYRRHTSWYNPLPALKLAVSNGQKQITRGVSGGERPRLHVCSPECGGRSASIAQPVPRRLVENEVRGNPQTGRRSTGHLLPMVLAYITTHACQRETDCFAGQSCSLFILGFLAPSWHACFDGCGARNKHGKTGGTGLFGGDRLLGTKVPLAMYLVVRR